MPDILRIILAQLNLRVGDIAGNTEKIIQGIETARNDFHSDIILFPELAITSYPPEDLLLRSALHQQVSEALEEITKSAHGIVVLISHPEKKNHSIYNACSILRDSKIQETYYKQILPNYGVFDEKRYFTEGHTDVLFDVKGVPVAITICEDIWEPGPARNVAAKGARLLLNINASPYYTGKTARRRNILQQRVEETGLNVVYLNLVGGQDDLVFDGDSVLIDSRGNIQQCATPFSESLIPVEFSLQDGGLFHLPEQRSIKTLSDEESIYRALVLGTRDYVRKNGFKGALVGLSGGIDSALTLCLAVDALGRENVEALIMPSRYTAAMSVEDAEQLATNLGIKAHIISIEKPFSAFDDILQPLFAGLAADITEENIQARCRGILLMAVSNKTGKLVFSTGNKSEMAVGYATLYGDMAGGLAPLKDVSKMQVYALSRLRNEKTPDIPVRILERLPSAELREDQLDQDSLPDYETLDRILLRYIELDQSPADIIKDGFDSETVQKIVRLVDRNEYKRRQSAPGIRITKRAFGRDRRYPITSGYCEQ